jgi:hypothetical protein
MTKMLLILGILFIISPVFADDYPQNDRFNMAYDEVNDTTTITDKVTWGEPIPNTGDAFTGHCLYVTLQIKYQGKRYNPSDTDNTSANLMFVELHYKADDVNFQYEDQDNVALLVDGTRFKLGKADYSQRIGGDNFIGKRGLEILSVPVDLSVLETIANSRKVVGAITAKSADASKTFSFGPNDFQLVSKALDLLDSLKQKTAEK